MSPYRWQCPGCGEQQEAPVWRILDAAERPDAVEPLAPGLAIVECPDCGATDGVQATMLLIRPGEALPLLLAVADSELTEPSSVSGQQLAREAQAAGAGGRDGVVGPMIPLPRLLLVLALTRDVSADAADPDSAYEQVRSMGEPFAGLYRTFLGLVRGSEPTRRAGMALRELLKVAPDDLLGFLETHPELGGDAALAVVTDQLSADISGDNSEMLQAQMRLVDSLADGTPAHQVATEYLKALERLGEKLNERFVRLANLAGENPGPDGIPLAREALEMAAALGHRDAEAELSADLAVRLLTILVPDAQSAEEAIRLLQRALSLISDSDPRWPSWAGNLAAALNRRVTGDLTENWEAARDLLDRACAATDREATPRSWAINHTNYGLLMAERPGGPRPGDLGSGIEHMQAALKVRSPQANVVDWAYSQLNLGLLFRRRAMGDDLKTAAKCYRQALAYLKSTDHPQVWATLQVNLGDVLLSSDPADAPGAARGILAALDVTDPASDPLTCARLLWTLGRAEDIIHGERSPEAMQARQDALQLLAPAQAPDLYRRIGGELVAAYSQLGRWNDAAELYCAMLTAFSALYDAQASAEGRRDILTRSPNLARWAAYALARAGRPEQAVETIENGRARQLSSSLARETADLARLTTADPRLADRYHEALAQYRAALAVTDQTPAPLDARARVTVAEHHIQLLLHQIRGIPALEGFLQPMSVTDIRQAGHGYPVTYLISAPGGSYVLTVLPGQASPPVVDAVPVPDVTSTDVLQVAMFGYEGAPGLLSAQAADTLSRFSLLPAALNRLTEIRPLIQPVVNILRQSPANRVIVIPTGLLGLIPLHAIPLSDGNGQVLDDAGEMYLAPSAGVFAACRKRTSAPRTEHLLGVADPQDATRSLPGSRAELSAIRALFAKHGATTCAFGSEATRSWLLQHVGQASHLHLACHGASAPGTTAEGRLYLAEKTTLTIGDLIDGRLDGCRLAIASACQSGHYSTTGAADEFTGLPAGFLQSGAACAIVSLWQVNDRATALLMTRFYELVLQPDRDTETALTPIAALRQARAWLRHLTTDQLEIFIQKHASLAQIFNQPQEAPGTRMLPYAAPQHWAAFTAWGA
jgi:CHAT domain-containing protein/tetratricopeptide (TPR) repeat protein